MYAVKLVFWSSFLTIRFCLQTPVVAVVMVVMAVVTAGNVGVLAVVMVVMAVVTAGNVGFVLW
jgi:hypothetical protein